MSDNMFSCVFSLASVFNSATHINSCYSWYSATDRKVECSSLTFQLNSNKRQLHSGAHL